MFNVGLLYQLGGDGLAIDLGKAVMWWERADNAGSGMWQSPISMLRARGAADPYCYS